MYRGPYRNVLGRYEEPVFRSIGLERPRFHMTHVADIEELVNVLKWVRRVTAANKIRRWWKMKLVMRNSY